MTAAVILLNPDGASDTWATGDASALAEALFGGQTSVVTLPVIPIDGDTLVGFIHDWGMTNGAPVNRPAWALYGRSPICGPMFVALDSGDHMDDDLVAAILAPPARQMSEAMDVWLDGHERQSHGWVER